MEFFSDGDQHVGVRFNPNDDPAACTRVRRVLSRTCIDAVQEGNALHVILPEDETPSHAIAAAERMASIVPSDPEAHDAAVDIQRVGAKPDDAPFVMTRFSPFEHH